MDALKMLKTAKRYCQQVESCASCRLGIDCCIFDSSLKNKDVKLMTHIVYLLETWEREQPVKTKGDLFLERNPECKRSDMCHETPDIRPCDYDESINYPAVCCRFTDCQACKKAYWEEPVE